MRLHRPIYTLISYNVLCGSFLDPIPVSRFRAQTEKIRKLKPDLVCLQEFNNLHVEKIYRQELSSEYHVLVDRIPHAELARRIVLCASMISVSYVIHPYMAILCVVASMNPYVHNFVVGTQRTGNAVLVHKSHPIDCVKTKEFCRQDGDFLNLIRKRGFIDIQFHDILVRNTHLNHGPDRVNCRETQIYECLEHVTSKTLLVGDFNTENVSPISGFGFRDCTKHLGFTYRKENPLTHRCPSNKRIDYVFSFGVNVLESKKLDFFSDHDAFIIKFQ